MLRSVDASALRIQSSNESRVPVDEAELEVVRGHADGQHGVRRAPKSPLAVQRDDLPQARRLREHDQRRLVVLVHANGVELLDDCVDPQALLGGEILRKQRGHLRAMKGDDDLEVAGGLAPGRQLLA